MVRSCPAAAVAPNPVDQSNFYGTPANDYDEVSQDSGFARVEYDIRPTVQLRSQLRYNQTHRTAVISTIQNPAAYNPATELVTIARQGNERENRDHLEPDQRVGRRPRRTDVARAHRHGRVHERVAVRADARRPRHAAARRHLRARRQRPGDGDGRGPDRRVQRRHRVDRGGVGVRHRRRGLAPAAHRRHARRALRRDLPGARRGRRRDDRRRHRRHARQRQGRRALQAHRPGQRLRRVGERRRRRPAPRTSR